MTETQQFLPGVLLYTRARHYIEAALRAFYCLMGIKLLTDRSQIIPILESKGKSRLNVTSWRKNRLSMMSRSDRYRYPDYYE